MADAIVIGVVDNNYVKHYAYIHPDLDSRRTYCGKDASLYESTEQLEQLRQSVDAFSGSMTTLANSLQVDANRKIAAFFAVGIDMLKKKAGDFNNYHRDMCRPCVERLNEDGNA